MRRITNLLLLLVIVVITACSGKNANQKEDTQVVMQDSTDAHGLQRMQVSKSETNITFKGKEYHSVISRTPDEELPLVTSEMGDTYVDNKIQLRLTRNNDVVVSTTFTKSNFSAYVSAEFLSKSILEGIVYDKTTPQGMVFAASICYPQTDLYIPLSITISADGKMSIEKVEVLEEDYSADTI
ncbi:MULTISPECIES: DUF4738 domain-containing protein [Bacteroides]|uniref:DUF4738 domain-containing protein n=1 Tax=Bacteroides TaxID=816 RepID=UPI0005A825E2|nr:DUF4738 domain-containing protein [Bacteroides neonati]